MRHLTWVLLVIAGAANGSESSEMLAAHNALGAKVGVPPLVWSDRLATRAQSWAETLLAHNEFAHSPKSGFGENLFKVSHGHVSSGIGSGTG